MVRLLTMDPRKIHVYEFSKEKCDEVIDGLAKEELTHEVVVGESVKDNEMLKENQDS